MSCRYLSHSAFTQQLAPIARQSKQQGVTFVDSWTSLGSTAVEIKSKNEFQFFELNQSSRYACSLDKISYVKWVKGVLATLCQKIFPGISYLSGSYSLGLWFKGPTLPLFFLKIYKASEATPWAHVSHNSTSYMISAECNTKVTSWTSGLPSATTPYSSVKPSKLCFETNWIWCLPGLLTET